MKRDLLDLASSLTRRGVSFVMATVVRREGGSAAHVGDMALLTGDGAFHGWIGSNELRVVVEREAVRVLTERRPYLICLSSSPEREARPGVLSLPSPEKGGSVDIYLAPVITAPRLVLIGRSPVLRALAQLARAIGYRVDRVFDRGFDRGLARIDGDPAGSDDGIADRTFTRVDDPRLVEADGAAVMAVVAPSGERAPGTSDDTDDADAIVGALAMSPSYLGVIASRRRFALLRDALSSRGVAAGAVDRIAHPAGLALGAHEPGEVAVAILAQMVARRNGVVAVNEASVTLSESSEVTSTMDIVVEGADKPADKQVDKALADKAATASCFPTPVRDEASGATLALRVRGSSTSLETRARASSTSPPPSDGTPLPVAIPGGLPAGAPGAPDAARTVERAVDPVCQVNLVTADAHHAGSWDHRTWYFCSAACKAKFFANPLRYSGFAPPVR